VLTLIDNIFGDFNMRQSLKDEKETIGKTIATPLAASKGYKTYIPRSNSSDILQ
jgi:hypothetical protein